MGRTRTVNNEATYLGISHGAFYEGKGDEKTFWTTDGRSDGLEGIITKIEEYDFEWQGAKIDMIRISMTDTDGKNFEISAQKDSQYIHNLLSRLVNISPVSVAVTLTPYKIEDNGKTVIGVAVRCEGEKIYPAFSKDNPCPVEPKIYEGKKGKEYDFEPQINYFLENIKVSPPNFSTTKAINQAELAEDLGMRKIEEDDLPF